jgi:uncharacterized protein YxjI
LNMNPILSLNLFFIKEHVRIFKAANIYDIYNPETEQIVLNCREENLGFFTRLFRFTSYKRMTPFDIDIRTPEGEKIITVRRGVSFFISNVEVFDNNGMLLGRFRQKFFSIGGKFEVLDASDQPLCMLRGKWTSWEFKFVSADENELASVTKKWSGIGKELFTTADNYILRISQEVPKDSQLRQLILAAVMCIDLVLKE